MASSSSKRPLPSTSTAHLNGGSTSSASKKVKRYDSDDDDDFDLPITDDMIDQLDQAEQEELTKPVRTNSHPVAITSRSPVPPTLNAPTPRTPDPPMAAKTTTRADWTRPPAPPIDPKHDTISFQQIDMDHYIGDPLPGMPGFHGGSVPVLRMYGVTEGGNSVCAHLHGFLPYFYVPLPSEEFKVEHCAAFRSSLDGAVLRDMRSNKDGITTAVVSVDICER